MGISDDEEPIKFLIDSTPNKWDPDEINQSIIEKDIKWTFPESKGFMTTESLSHLKRVLIALSRTYTDLGYV